MIKFGNVNKFQSLKIHKNKYFPSNSPLCLHPIHHLEYQHSRKTIRRNSNSNGTKIVFFLKTKKIIKKKLHGQAKIKKNH